MYFKRIDICGFKSFAEPVSIDLSKGITCIVGPNGSGKSNVSDAIRWVLGEQSPKILRGGKMEDVIFAGTAKRRSKGMAEVVLVIDNTSKILPIDYSEVAITRRAFRSGEGEYYINANQCRLKDIRELIMDTGIGVDGYSLIGQGKIADIVSNKVESRREIFEEAAGIVKYRSKKAEAEKKLENTKLNLSRVNDIIFEISSRIETLKSESDIAKEFLKLSDEYKKVEVNVILKNIEDIELKNEYLKDDLVDFSVKLEEISENQAKLKEEIAKGQEELGKLEILLEEARVKRIRLTEEISEINSENILRKEKLNLFEKEEERLSQAILQSEKALDSAVQSRQSIVTELKTIESKITSLNEEVAQKEKELQFEKLSGEELLQKVEEKKQNIFDLHSLMTSEQAESLSLQNLLETLDKKRAQLLEEEEECDIQKQVRDEEIHTLEEQARQKNERKFDGEKEFEKEQAELAGISKDLKKLSEELQKNNYNVADLSARKRTLQELESNYDGFSYAVKYVMKRNFAGVHGVLADLIKVPSGLELAIETALASALQNVVCKDEETARNIIEILKREKIGRLTFLPISSMRGEAVKLPAEILRNSGVRGVACDCIEFDEKYQGIVRYLLGKVLIVDNLSNAIAITKKMRANFRIVTLEGDVINAGGAITGGAYKNKIANIFERKAEIEELAKKLTGIESENKKLQSKISELTDFQREKSELFAKLQNALKVLQIECLETQNSLKLKKDELLSLESRSKKRKSELEAIFDEKESTQKVFESLSSKNADIALRIESLKAEVENDMKILQDAKEPEKLKADELLKLKDELSKVQNQRNLKEFELKEIQKQEEKERAYIERSGSELKKVSEDISNLKSESVEFVNIENKQKEKDVLEKYIDEISEKRKKLFEEGRIKESASDEFANRRESMADGKYELEIKLAKNESSLENYKNKLWDEFEISYIQAASFKSDEINFQEAQKQARKLKSQIKELGNVNVGAIKEYEEIEKRAAFLNEQKEDIKEAMDSLKSIIEDMDKTIKLRFKESFEAIAENFEIVFKELFGGGNAMLEMDNTQDPLESTIEIIAQPPGKKLQNINLLSGGEKTMTAIALMFAVLKAKPTPFCILDEVEAALDDGNIQKFANYLRKFDNIQFALITHQKVTMEHADVLYGITMPEQGVSKLLSLKLLDDAV